MRHAQPVEEVVLRRESNVRPQWQPSDGDSGLDSLWQPWDGDSGLDSHVRHGGRTLREVLQRAASLDRRNA